MFLRKSAVVVACLGLMAACSSPQSGADSSDAASGLTRAEAEKVWTDRVGKIWAKHTFNKGPESDYWLTPSEISEILLTNKYYSKVVENTAYASAFSRGFCGSSSYDQVIGENIGTDSNGIRHAESQGFINLGGGNGDEDVLGEDAMFALVSMGVFKINQGVQRGDVGKVMFTQLQDRIASEGSSRCRFRMRQTLGDETKFGDPQNAYIRGWYSERDFICPEQPCIGSKNPPKFETLLSDEGSTSGGGFYLLQSNLTGRPLMRSVVFVPRPAESAVLLLEVVTGRNYWIDKPITGELAEQHAKVAAALSIAWVNKSANAIKLEELEGLYTNAQPVSDSSAAAIYRSWQMWMDGQLGSPNT